MARPPQCRRIERHPTATYFKPRGVPLNALSENYLSVEGLEAIRLADLEGMTSEQAAKRMDVSRHTFGRILAKARKTISEALVFGRALRIDGGDYSLAGASNDRTALAADDVDVDDSSRATDS